MALFLVTARSNFGTACRIRLIIIIELLPIEKAAPTGVLVIHRCCRLATVSILRR